MTGIEYAPSFLEGLAGFEDLETILVPNEITTVDPRELWEGPQIVSLGGDNETFPVRLRWDGLKLVSTQLRETNASTIKNRIDWNAVLVGIRVMDVQVKREGKAEWVSDGHFLAEMVRQANPNDRRTDEDILNAFHQRGLSVGKPMPMFLQHLGADVDQFNEIVEVMKEAGATDNTASVRTTGSLTKTLAAWRLTDGKGLPVTSIDFGVADRNRSKTGNGFIGWLDATLTSAFAIAKINGTLRALDAVKNDPSASDHDKEAAESQRAKLRAYWWSGDGRDRRPFHSHGGTQVVEDTDGTFKYFATPVPCGALRVLVDGAEVPFSVWPSASKLAARANGEALPTEQALATAVAEAASASVEPY